MRRISATVFEHLMRAESVSFIEAVRSARSRMLEEAKEKDCIKSTVTGLCCLNGAVGLAAIAASATGVGLAVAGISGLIYFASKPLDKLSNHASLSGELYLWQNTEIKSWLVRAWERGYPIGQVVTAYSDFCEEVGLYRPEARLGIATDAAFVAALNRSADQFSGLPPVVKIGERPAFPASNPAIQSAFAFEPEPQQEEIFTETESEEVLTFEEEETFFDEADPWDSQALELETIEAVRSSAEIQIAELNRQQVIERAAIAENNRRSTFDLIQDIATASGQEWVKSIMWLGPSRSGKSWAMAAALQESVHHWEAQGQSVGVWWLSAKCDPREHNYAHGRGYNACSEEQIDELERDELEDVFAGWHALLMEFTRSKSYDKRLLVFDELNLAASFCTPNPKVGFQPGPMASKFWQFLISQAIACSSNGRGQGKALWLASQMASMGGLGLSTDQCGVFHEKVVFLSPTDAGGQFEKGAFRSGFISERLDPHAVKVGSTGRYYHYQGRWRGLPEIAMPQSRLQLQAE